VTDFIVVIPARLASTRLPNKPLADIHGKPMVVRVAARAAQSRAKHVYVVTDSASVMDACAAHRINARMTRADHATGTDRLAEFAEQLRCADDDIIVNVQGDEPLIAPQMIDEVASLLARMPACSIATAAHAITSREEFFNPNVVKVVCNAEGIAHYFSRAPIPYARDHFAKDNASLPPNFIAQRHIGIYAYRAQFLKRFAALAPAPTEQFEALEQLRAMYHGEQIAVVNWQGALVPGVDTPEDLAHMRALPPQAFS
jgi:3-deoxy-manno-octulosonate cytidylyltransferase (CMP-KDO synthetase)